VKIRQNSGIPGLKVCGRSGFETLWPRILIRWPNRFSACRKSF